MAWHRYTLDGKNPRYRCNRHSCQFVTAHLASMITHALWHRCAVDVEASRMIREHEPVHDLGGRYRCRCGFESKRPKVMRAHLRDLDDLGAHIAEARLLEAADPHRYRGFVELKPDAQHIAGQRIAENAGKGIEAIMRATMQPRRM